MPLSAGEPIPTDTGSITIVDQSYEEELPDDVDETDRAFIGLGPVTVDTAGIAIVPGPIHPPSGPISTVRIPPDEVVLGDAEPVRVRAFSLEESGPEPTAVDHRVGRSARLFWLWFASNSSILSIGLGATVFAVGMSLRQSIVAVLAGVALSFIPLGLTTLAGKRSGQPTMVVSRATFGVVGNVLPAILALLTRVYWGAVLLWLLGSSVAIVLIGAGLDAALGERQLLLISLAIAFLVALLVAFAGYPLFSRVQLVLSIVSGVLIVGLIALTWKYVNIGAALSTPDGSWTLTISGAVLVFSFVGLVWANSGADLARYQRPGSSGAASMLWATFGTTLPTFILIGYGALLAASDPGIAKGFLIAPLDTLALMLPAWYPVPLLAATGLSLLSGITLTMYSGGFALQAIGVHVRRQWSIVIVAVLLGGVAVLLTFGVTGGMTELFRDLATTLAVPTAAWAGIFGAEMMIRNRRFESDSLVRRGGIYADVRWVNLVALIVISAIGYGLTTATVTWLSWQGYGFALLGMPLDSALAASDLGVLVALVLGILTPLVAGVPAIRKQEAARA
jgi:purine-cytosine permease-like protein